MATDLINCKHKKLPMLLSSFRVAIANGNNILISFLTLHKPFAITASAQMARCGVVVPLPILLKYKNDMQYLLLIAINIYSV